MIRAADVRIVGLGVLLLFAAGACKPASTGSGKAPPNLNIVGPNNPNAGGQRPQAVEFLGGFLKSLAEGKAGPDACTAAFKAKVARPKYQNEQHEKLGFDPDKLEAFMKKSAQGSYDGIEALPAGSGTYFVSMGKSAGKTENCLFRLVPADDAAGWRIDWLQRTATVAPPYRDASLTPHQAEARVAAVAFVSTLLDDQLDLAEALMTKNRKGELAWSNTPSNQSQGYDSTLLKKLHLEKWKGTFNEFSIAKQDIAEGKPAAFEGELVDTAKKQKRTYTMIVVKDASGEWLVDKFEAK